MSDTKTLIELSHAIASAIAVRDISMIGRLLAPGFAQRTPGGASNGAEAFLHAIMQIPGQIVFVRVEDLEVDIVGDSAVLTGIQTAQLNVEGRVIDDRRAFVDYFVRIDGRWLLRTAVDLATT
jgi:hypothetical protein